MLNFHERSTRLGRLSLNGAALIICLALGFPAARAQLAGRSSGEIAAASQILAKKYDTCRHEARDLKLSFVQRRIYIHRCVRK